MIMGTNKRPKASQLPKQNPTVESEKTPNRDGNKFQHDLQMNLALGLGGKTPQLGKEASLNGLPSPRKRAKNQAVVVRRSGRLQSIYQTVRLNTAEPVIEEVEISEDKESDEEEENAELTTPGEIVSEERTDPVLEAQNEEEDQEAHNPSKGPKFSPKKGQGPSRADLHYRSLYFESQKKVESLMEENHQLEKKLENALGKLEVYEKGPSLLAEAFNSIKGTILISNMSQAAETATNISAQAIGKCFDASHVAAPRKSPPKRKGCKKNERGMNELMK